MELNSRYIDCYFFSGSGNTEYIANIMLTEFKQNDFIIKKIPINNYSIYDIDLDHIILLAIPVANQGTYPFVWEFIENLPISEGTQVIFLTTFSKSSSGLEGAVKGVLKKKGYNPITFKKYKMPDYFLRTIPLSDKEIKNLLNLEMKIKNFTLEIIHRKVYWEGFSLNSKGVKNSNYWKKLNRKYKLMSVTGFCNNCGKCVDVCPVKNIKFSNGEVLFGNECQFCQKCLSVYEVGGILVFCNGESLNYITSEFYHK